MKLRNVLNTSTSQNAQFRADRGRLEDGLIDEPARLTNWSTLVFPYACGQKGQGIAFGLRSQLRDQLCDTEFRRKITRWKIGNYEKRKSKIPNQIKKSGTQKG